jgi:ribosome biogenesis GTPase
VPLHVRSGITPLSHATLAGLGWSALFLSQLDLSELSLLPVRIAAVHRNRAAGLGAAGPVDLTAPPDMPMSDLAVGDWVLATDAGRIVRRLDRRSHIARRAAGTGAQVQSIAANVDTLFLVTSCNAEFSERRLERYLALAHEAGTEAVVVLTKADTADPAPFVQAAERLSRGLLAVALDARAPGDALTPWCGPGRTVALVGSSGVGKTTLTNALAGTADATSGIREDDARGRHTTTYRALRPLPGGGWVLDTPGMRELRLADVADGIDATFAEITDLAPLCRFRDCTHDGEPGCAVAAAIDAGTLDPDRVRRWHKLRREDRHNTETLAEAHARNRAFGRIVREAVRSRRDRRGPS